MNLNFNFQDDESYHSGEHFDRYKHFGGGNGANNFLFDFEITYRDYELTDSDT